MVVLIVFAFIAGAATALSPCVLPVLPVALAAGATGGRRRPLGVVTGLVLSFTFATIALVYVISALGLPDDLLRNLAIAVLAGFGVALLVPRLSARVETALSRLARRGPVVPAGDGFGSGLVLGASLGLVYAPCAGPILAGVITVSAAQDFTVGRLAVALAYALGSALVLYGLMLGGRSITARLRGRTGQLQSAMGAVMVLVAVLMAFELDIRFQSTIAEDLPAVLVNPSRELEASAATRDRLADLSGGGDDGVAQAATRAQESGDAVTPAALPVIAAAPEIRGTQRWWGTDGDRPLTLASQRGRVVLIDFWTYSCINCVRTLPYLKRWDARYRDAGLTIIGLHAPEFPFERDAGNVGRAIRANGLRYPVAQDNDFATWRAYGNRYWPAKYLIDARGRVRYVHFGEGEYEQTEDAIRALLAEAGRAAPRAAAVPGAASDGPASAGQTPESYLGFERAERFVGTPPEPGRARFAPPPGRAGAIPLHHLALEGRWRVERARSVAAGEDARLHLRFRARRVFLVLGSAGGPRSVAVRLDGRPRRAVRVRSHRLYEVARLPRAGEHLLTLTLPKGTEAYAFTFG
jgi:cytochrome c biogenesis protein CcdA/thiol-disulfide isomerase/thioredoxin